MKTETPTFYHLQFGNHAEPFSAPREMTAAEAEKSNRELRQAGGGLRWVRSH